MCSTVRVRWHNCRGEPCAGCPQVPAGSSYSTNRRVGSTRIGPRISTAFMRTNKPLSQVGEPRRTRRRHTICLHEFDLIARDGRLGQHLRDVGERVPETKQDGRPPRPQPCPPRHRLHRAKLARFPRPPVASRHRPLPRCEIDFSPGGVIRPHDGPRAAAACPGKPFRISGI